LKGRFFTEADDAQHPPVIIVSATTARHLFGNDDPIGQTFAVPKFQYRRSVGDEATVIGIVSDVKYSGIDRTAGDQVYWSMALALAVDLSDNPNNGRREHHIRAEACRSLG